MGSLSTSIVLMVFLVGFCAPQNVDDILLLTLKTITDGQDKIVQKFDDLQTEMNEIKVQVQELRDQVEEGQNCSTRDQVDSFKTTFVKAQDAVKRSIQQCSTYDQIIEFQTLFGVDECEEGTHNCSSLASCFDSPLLYHCKCLQGYTGDGFTCQDVDECRETSRVCGAVQICTNLPGSYSCSCHEGYKKRGNSCQDINECELGVHRCHTDATCTNTLGSYTCTCFPNYAGDGHTCKDINECASGVHGCHAYATCTNTMGSYICTCHSNYEGDGYTCNACISPSHIILNLGCVTPVMEEMSWDEAQSNCNRKGGRLLEGIKREHLTLLKQKFSEYFVDSDVQIGLRGAVWVKTKVTVRPGSDLWMKGEPSGSEDNKSDCGQIRLNTDPPTLFDYPCSYPEPSLCQHLD